MLVGLSIALFYDIYWLLFAYRRRSFLLRVAEDLLFWLAAFCLAAALWLYLTGGVMRLAVYLWLALGMALFRAFLSPRLRRLRPPAKLPPGVRCPPAEPTPPPVQEQNPNIQPRLQRIQALPNAAMLQTGLGFWRAADWLVRQGRRGGSWLIARLPKRQPPPEEPPELPPEP